MREKSCINEHFREVLARRPVNTMGEVAPLSRRAFICRVGVGRCDGGIDGIIKEDRLGLDAIYLQAKRWEGVVGSARRAAAPTALRWRSAIRPPRRGTEHFKGREVWRIRKKRLEAAVRRLITDDAFRAAFQGDAERARPLPAGAGGGRGAQGWRCGTAGSGRSRRGPVAAGAARVLMGVVAAGTSGARRLRSRRRRDPRREWESRRRAAMGLRRTDEVVAASAAQIEAGQCVRYGGTS